VQLLANAIFDAAEFLVCEIAPGDVLAYVPKSLQKCRRVPSGLSRHFAACDETALSQSRVWLRPSFGNE
jgi:hypothetical protein